MIRCYLTFFLFITYFCAAQNLIPKYVKFYYDKKYDLNYELCINLTYKRPNGNIIAPVRVTPKSKKGMDLQLELMKRVDEDSYRNYKKKGWKSTIYYYEINTGIGKIRKVGVTDFAKNGDILFDSPKDETLEWKFDLLPFEEVLVKYLKDFYVFY